ncbi:MAG: MYXO-CTERM sorting domain-containing protein [Chthoniobacterales bacterium]
MIPRRIRAAVKTCFILFGGWVGWRVDCWSILAPRKGGFRSTEHSATAFRYLQIWTLSYANTPLSPNGTGLYELRVFEAQPAPEPGTWAAAALLLGGAAWVRRRRRKS